ncbi:MAG: transglycosylase SLT domain-containing protein [Spirochaetaceae bacterium]|nr:transglycosylase SLT domain-containing protein [Spirochaetaceae bacterium]
MKIPLANRLITIAAIIAAGAAALSSCSRPFHPDLEKEILRLAALEDRDIHGFIEDLEREDSIGGYYRDPATRETTVDFFASLTRSPAIARVILENAEQSATPPALAFALAYEESDFRSDAYNDNGDSIDRGLFQLNSKSFPKLDIKSFYDPAVNARYGLGHLQFCLRTAGNEVAALAMYNAGRTRVSKGRTPQKTLNYVHRIMSYRDNIESLFVAKVVVGPRPARLSLR